MRIGGLASGMDTDSIIKDMMKANRIPLDKIMQKKQYTQWQLDDYRKINRDLRTAEYKLSDTMVRQATFMKKNVSVSNESAVSIKSLSSTSDFSGTIAVHQLATQATMTGKTLKHDDKKMTEAQVKTLKMSELGIDESDEMVINVPGSNDNVKITIKPDDTISSVLKKINENSGVNAFFDEHTGKIALTAKESGVGEIRISGNLAKKLNVANVADATNPNSAKLIATGLPEEQYKSSAGQNAIFTFNGLQTERSSNTFQISGFEVNLKSVTSPDPTSGEGVVTFNSTTDTDSIVDSVVQFVNDYNEMIESLNSKIREKTYRNFQPLSDEQKKDMKEKEIELWEEKAMSGTLRNDPAISSLLTTLRGVMSHSVEGADGKKFSLVSMGIEQSKSYSDNGKLIIDEDKLRKAVAEHPDEVYKLIGSSEKTGDPAKPGIAVQYRDELRVTQKSISAKAGTTSAVNDTFALGRTMKQIDKQIERFQDRLQMTEDRLWKQFAAMERAIQRANAQSAQLMSSFGGGM